MKILSLDEGGFRLGGAPFRLLSGAMHYFRVQPAQWPQRLAMIRAMGLNTVETYVPWNLHEPSPGRYERLDELTAFLQEAARQDLHAIVRPGPYICAEWDNGGLPWWLTGRLRTSDPEFLEHVDSWFEVLIPRIAEQQTTQGGNVLMVQVENEYGSYGTDQAYLVHLTDLLHESGIDVPLFTADGPEDHMLTGGTLPGLLATGTFGNDPETALATLRKHRPADPQACMELWIGWFDHWGGPHTPRDPADAADTLERLLETGASVNLYMAHGGTSFGLWAGANRDPQTGRYQPTVTSYDYDAPITEDGRATEKYWRFREVLTRYQDAPEPPPPPTFLAPAVIPVSGSVPLRDAIDVLAGPEVTAPMPPTFEQLGIGQGLAHYRVEIPGPRGPYPLVVAGLRDRALLYVDGTPAGTLEDGHDPIQVAGPATVELIVSSLGRVNYGPTLGESKGIVNGIRHERQYLHQVTARPVPLDDPSALEFGPALAEGPGFHRAVLTVAEPAEAFLALPGWGHGIVWVNGFCLGRYWSIGPQRTLYLPSPVLRTGDNEVIVLELESPGTTLELRDTPDLG
ncbi:beta-galactosidase family protein [Nonomuraea sp. NPDC000554]|uniref:glycoside hydrolase family 35 protein n=1 Tax=Nonomuraea sp. NPDC000554 TaxID=3154259 RepID=UPI003323024A